MPTPVIAVDVDCYDATIPGVRTLRYATIAFTTRPSDTPANTFYEGRIKQPGNFQRNTFTNQRTFGQTQISFGEVVLSNYDGALDGLVDYAFAGRPITIKFGNIADDGTPPTTWTTVIRGSLEQAELSWQEVTFRIRDRQLDVAKPIQQTRFAGTGNMEGGANLTGKPKPLVFGSVLNIAPPLVDTTRLIYQVHSGSTVNAVSMVYDRGARLTAGAAYTSLSDIQTNAPAAGTFRVWNDTTGCYFRLAANPSGVVTADVVRGAAVANRTVGQLFSQILQAAGISASDISTADITALDAVAAYDTGVYANHDNDVTALQLLDDLCASVGAWYGTDALGTFRIGQIALPTGTSVGTLTTTEILKIERVASRDTGAGIPAWKVKVAYQYLYEVLDDLTNTATVTDKAYFSEEYRRVEASDATVKTAYILSPEIEFKTQLVSSTDATAEASRRLTIYKTRRDMYQVTVRVDSTLAGLLDLGKIVTLQINRFGMSAGKKFLIIGIRANVRLFHYELTLWG